MSAADDERRRLSKTYRELAATELFSMFEKRDGLSAVAIDCLRVELRLRGLDPDSLRATVPKATPTEDEGPGGDASLADADAENEPSKAGHTRAGEREGDVDADAENEPEPPPPPPADEAASPAEAAASAAAIRCASCGTRNPAIEDVCLKCGQPLGDSPAGQTMSRRITEPRSGASSSRQATGTVGSATTGVVGISALVFASYSLTLERRVIAVSLGAAALGLAALAAAILLHRLEKRRRDRPAAN